MLQNIRDRFTGVMALILIGGIGVAMVIGLVNTDTGMQGRESAASVNGEDIALTDYREVVQQQVLQLLAALQRRHGMAYVFITHDLAVVRAMAHQVIVMKDGRIVERGEAGALFAAPREAYTKELLAASLPELPAR